MVDAFRERLDVVFISNMDSAVRFYRDILGMRLTNRYDPHWATVEAGNKLVIGLHPESPHSAPPGPRGARKLGRAVEDPIGQGVGRVAASGLKVTGGVIRSEVRIEDPDGNLIVLREDETRSTGPKQQKLQEAQARS